MKNIQYLFKTMIIALALIMVSCEVDDKEFGDLIFPSNISLTYEIVGKNTANPFGDGSGTVKFTATSNDVITYKFVHEGSESMAPSGTKTFNFSKTGTHKYTVTVVAIGTGGLTSSKSVEVEVFAKYVPPADLLQMLNAGGTRTWRLKAEGAGHFGVGPADADSPIWWAAAPNDKAGKGAYDDRFVFNANGDFTHKTNNTAFGKVGPMDTDLGVPPSGTVVNGDGEYENYPLADYTEKWSLSAPGGVETLTFSKKGYHGFYVGGNHSYVILKRTANEMHLRTVGADGLGWFAILIAE
jgi:hypothetical protein